MEKIVTLESVAATLDDLTHIPVSEFAVIHQKFDQIDNRFNVMDHRLGDIDSQLIEIKDDLKATKAGVQTTAEILEQKQIITSSEKHHILHATDPFLA